MAYNTNSSGVIQTLTGQNPAPEYDASGNVVKNKTDAIYNVVNDYTWTLNPRRGINNTGRSDSINDVPYVKLTEYQVDESFIKQQISNFLSNTVDIGGSIGNVVVGGIANGTAAVLNAAATLGLGKGTDYTYTPTWRSSTDRLKPYESLYRKNKTTKTNNIYIFPYFDETNFEINTPAWESIDALAAASSIGGSLSDLAFGKNSEYVKGIAKNAMGLGSALLATSSPKVAALDRPRLWSSHSPRTINIKFPLFNTRNADDWIKNRGLCWTLVHQNLFQKLDTVNNIPPVFYEIVIPGQHYSFAASVTRLTIINKGNMHTFPDPVVSGAVCIVPDAYEVDITLEDLVMPSQNLFEAIQSKQAEVTTSTAGVGGLLSDLAFGKNSEYVKTLPANVGTLTLNSPIANYGPTK
jgi:hypothetical protein